MDDFTLIVFANDRPRWVAGIAENHGSRARGDLRRQFRPAYGESILLVQRYRLRHRADAAEHHLVVDEMGLRQQHLISRIEQSHRSQRKCLVAAGCDDYLVWRCVDPVTFKEPRAQRLSKRGAPRVGRIDVHIGVNEAVSCRPNGRLRRSKMRKRLPEIDDRVSLPD